MLASWALAILTICWPIAPKDRPRKQNFRGKFPPSAPTHGNIRHGFVYERVPHITLKSIANNAEIDVIWEEYQTRLEPLRKQLNAALEKALGGVGDSPRG